MKWIKASEELPIEGDEVFVKHGWTMLVGRWFDQDEDDPAGFFLQPQAIRITEEDYHQVEWLKESDDAEIKTREEIIKKFIEWAERSSPDAWWIYENTDEAIKQFMEQREEE